MSSFGAAFVADVDSEQVAQAVLDRLTEAAGQMGEVVHAGVARSGGRWRASMYAAWWICDDTITGDDLFAGVGEGRAILADDMDEYGAVFTAWRVDDGAVSVVYRALIEGESERESPLDPPERTGEQASRELAELWGADAEELFRIDSDRSALSDEIGVIGGPFPWFEALGVPWPGG